ncbi:MAG: NTP transferase domain-containing protein [Actinomycetota bacterium]|nr:NTP transferase domain-containing protein [Actinomycetota bacterium]
MRTEATGRRAVAVVVLAAGHGRRLGAAGGPGPKWLIEVEGAPIAERHLTAIEQALGPGTRVVVVAGYAAERVERYCEARTERSALRPQVVLNDGHAERNNWYSLLVGLDALEGTLRDEDVVVVLNSDLFGLPIWLESLLAAAAELDGVPGFLAVDVVRPLTSEAMKVAAGPIDAVGRRWCTDIGKVGVADPIGEYVGMAALGSSARSLLHDTLRAFDGKDDRVDAWYEGAIQEASAVSPFLVVWPTPSSEWVEVDDAADLHLAERLALTGVTDPATDRAPAPRPPVRPDRSSRGS